MPKTQMIESKIRCSNKNHQSEEALIYVLNDDFDPSKRLLCSFCLKNQQCPLLTISPQYTQKIFQKIQDRVYNYVKSIIFWIKKTNNEMLSLMKSEFFACYEGRKELKPLIKIYQKELNSIKKEYSKFSFMNEIENLKSCFFPYSNFDKVFETLFTRKITSAIEKIQSCQLKYFSLIEFIKKLNSDRECKGNNISFEDETKQQFKETLLKNDINETADKYKIIQQFIEEIFIKKDDDTLNFKKIFENIALDLNALDNLQTKDYKLSSIQEMLKTISLMRKISYNEKKKENSVKIQKIESNCSDDTKHETKDDSKSESKNDIFVSLENNIIQSMLSTEISKYHLFNKTELKLNKYQNYQYHKEQKNKQIASINTELINYFIRNPVALQNQYILNLFNESRLSMALQIYNIRDPNSTIQKIETNKLNIGEGIINTKTVQKIYLETPSHQTFVIFLFSVIYFEQSFRIISDIANPVRLLFHGYKISMDVVNTMIKIYWLEFYQFKIQLNIEQLTIVRYWIQIYFITIRNPFKSIFQDKFKHDEDKM